MSFAVIHPSGRLDLPTLPATGAAVNHAVGDPGFGLVRLPRTPDMYGFVNDSGHVLALPRNPVGSCLLVQLGAPAHPYAGPVVITGWTPRDDDSDEIDDLTNQQIDYLRKLHQEVLAERQVPGSRMADYAAWVADAPTPQPVVLHGAVSFGEVRHVVGDPQPEPGSVELTQPTRCAGCGDLLEVGAAVRPQGRGVIGECCCT